MFTGIGDDRSYYAVFVVEQCMFGMYNLLNFKLFGVGVS